MAEATERQAGETQAQVGQPQKQVDDYDERRFGHFKWLRRDTRGSTYNSYSRYAHLPACSFDWGSDGFAGSSNYGGELLYLSAPSSERGLIMARGNFSTSLYASLSRTQVKFGGPATFGLEIARADYAYDPASPDHSNGNIEKQSSFRLGRMIERGCFNYRWPVNEYYLDLHEQHRSFRHKKRDIDVKQTATTATVDSEHLTSNADEDYLENHVGTCQMFSFAMDSMFYQVLRIEEGGHIEDGDHVQSGIIDQTSSRDFPAESQVLLTMLGPLWLRSFDVHDRLRDHNLTKREKSDECEVVDVSTTYETPEGGKETTLRLWDGKRGIGLEARVYQYHPREKPDQQYKQLELIMSDSAADSGTPEAQLKTNLKAYNAVGKLEKATKKEGSRSEMRIATFLAAFRFFEAPLSRPATSEEIPVSVNWPACPLPEAIYKYVGVSPSSNYATGAMWDTVFINRLRKSESVFDLDEVNLIARSLEKILQVDLVPVSFSSDTKNTQYPVTGEEQTNAPTSAKETALVSNLFVRPHVDLKALFWKTRFLVRTYKFLSRLRETHDIFEHEEMKAVMQRKRVWPGDKALKLKLSETDLDSDRMLKTAAAQLNRIQKHINGIVRYLVRALLEPGLHTPVMPDSHLAGECNYYYVITTIWYVTRNFPEWNEKWRGLIGEWNGDGYLFKSDRLPSDNWTYEASDKDRVSLLQWFHYGSILGLCENEIFPKGWGYKGLQEKVSRLAKEAKICAAAKLSSRKSYSADDEILDRLSFLSDELGLEPRDYGGAGTVASISSKRVKQRDNTRDLNPGWLTHKDGGSTSGPWEIHALCHHSRLVVSSLEIKDSQDWRQQQHIKEEMDSIKQRVYYFRNAEGTLIPCWERAHAKARKGWLQSETTAVLASTLLMINEKDMKDKLTTAPSFNSKAEPETEKTPDTSLESLKVQRKVLREHLYMESLMKDEITVLEKLTDQAGRTPPILWTTFLPPRRYHPHDFFDSLEDTSYLYQPARLKKHSIPASLRSVITPPNEMTTEFNHKHLEQFLTSFCIFDLTATGPNQDAEGDTLEIVWHKFDDPMLQKLNELSDVAEFVEREDKLRKKDELDKLQLLNREGNLAEHKKRRIHELEKLLTPVGDLVALKAQQEAETEGLEKREGGADKLKEKIEEVNKLTEQKIALWWALYDSLVDQEVQHRFLTISPDKIRPDHTLAKHLLDLLVYVLHPSSAPCLGNHVLKFSRFSCQKGDTWVASITLRSWRVDKNGLQRKDKSSQTSKDDEPIYLPTILKRVWRKAQNARDPKETPLEKLSFELDVSSIVISTNAFGDFSKSTIVSKLIGEEDMYNIVQDTRKLWQKFIHQPQTARCLVFFLILGKMCQQITRNYTAAIKELTAILELNNSFDRNEQQWSNDKDSPLEFELGLWSLDSLHKLQYSLKASVSSLLEAKEDLMAQIRDGPGKRNVTLERLCQEYLGTFESSLVELVAENAKLERRIDLNTRYEESFSAVLAMRDSRASLSQNATIQRLTYLTIAYLPISLIAGISSIPEEHEVLFPIGKRWFGLGIVILSLGTYVLAFYIGFFLDFIKYCITGPTGSWKTGRTGFSGYSGTTRDTRPLDAPPSYQKLDGSSNQQNMPASLANGSSGEQPKNGLGAESEKEPVLIQDSIEEINPPRRRNQTDVIRSAEEGKGPGLTVRPHRTL